MQNATWAVVDEKSRCGGCIVDRLSLSFKSFLANRQTPRWGDHTSETPWKSLYTGVRERSSADRKLQNQNERCSFRSGPALYPHSTTSNNVLCGIDEGL